MADISEMSPKEIAQELVRLAANHPTSGNLRKLNKALDGYKGHGEMLDALLAGFDTATDQFIYRVQRGYAGTPEWRQLKEAAVQIAPALEIIEQSKAQQV